MAWNKPNEKYSKLDPWGKKEYNQPIFSDKKNKKKIKNIFNMNTDLYKIIIFIYKNYIFNKLKKKINFFFFFLFILFSLWLYHGFYTIPEGEKGILTRFNKFTDLVQPGLHWRSIFLTKLKNVNISTVHKIFSSNKILTKDNNIIHIVLNIQYKISNPVDYTFSKNQPDDIIHESANNILKNIIRPLNIYNILNIWNISTNIMIQKQIENMIFPYKIGVTIVNVSFQKIIFPKKI